MSGTGVTVSARAGRCGRGTGARTAARMKCGIVWVTSASACRGRTSTECSVSSAREKWCSTRPATPAPVPAPRSGTEPTAPLRVPRPSSTPTDSASVLLEPLLWTTAAPAQIPPTAQPANCGTVPNACPFLARPGSSLTGRPASSTFRIARSAPTGTVWPAWHSTSTVPADRSGTALSARLLQLARKAPTSADTNACLFPYSVSLTTPGTARTAFPSVLPPPAPLLSSTTGLPVSPLPAPPVGCGHLCTVSASAMLLLFGTDWAVFLVLLVKFTRKGGAIVRWGIFWSIMLVLVCRRCTARTWAMPVGTAVTAYATLDLQQLAPAVSARADSSPTPSAIPATKSLIQSYPQPLYSASVCPTSTSVSDSANPTPTLLSTPPVLPVLSTIAMFVCPVRADVSVAPLRLYAFSVARNSPWFQAHKYACKTAETAWDLLCPATTATTSTATAVPWTVASNPITHATADPPTAKTTAPSTCLREWSSGSQAQPISTEQSCWI